MAAAGVVGVIKDIVPPTLGENPEWILIGLLVVGALIGVGWLVSYLRRTPGETFARLVGSFEDAAVLMHPNPDPDAMSCALAVQELADEYETETTLYYPGQIRHHENRAFETVLDVTFNRIENAGQIDEESIILVDHNEPRGFPGAEDIDPLAVVDHHPGDGTGSEFTDVRTDNGSCASILSEYFSDLGWDPVGPDEHSALDNGDDLLPPDISTGLVYGVQSDTKRLTNGCSEAEFDAARYLYSGIDEDKLNRIANPDMDAESLDVKAEAIIERDVRSAFAVSDVGTVSNVDAVPQAADELLRLEGVNAVIVLADKEGTIHLSGRSNDDRVHMGKVLKAVVEDIPMANAGGHARMGGGQLSTDHMNGLGPGDGITREAFKERLFDAMNGGF